MKNLKIKKTVLIFFLVTAVASIGFDGVASQMQDTSLDYDCETCPMKVGTDAQEHLRVYDGNGTQHWVECIGCALKLLNTQDTLHIETYCDWYGPNYTIVVDISQHGKVTTVNPDTALILIGGGCTGNRVAYNQTAADNLLANGYSEYTMMMMQQPLPINTNTTTFTQRALSFSANLTATPNQQPSITLIVGIIIGMAVIASAFIAFKRFKK
jgi:hypothetical protein